MSCINRSHEYLDVDVDTSRALATRDVIQFYIIHSTFENLEEIPLDDKTI